MVLSILFVFVPHFLVFSSLYALNAVFQTVAISSGSFLFLTPLSTSLNVAFRLL